MNAAQARSGMHPRATLIATILASSLAFIDGSVVNVALPALAHDLNVAALDLSWAINAYLLPVGVLTLLGGALGDRYGRRRLFQIGLLIFAVASALCAAAPTLGVLLAARAAQGLGAALLMPNSLAILGGAFSGEAQGRAVGTWAAAGALAGALGPVVGGWVVDLIGWRPVFLINVPLAAAAGYLAWRYVAEQRADHASPLDVTGAALATLGLGLLIWALSNAPQSHFRAYPVIGAALVGSVVIGGFAWYERRLGEQALMPLALFRARSFLGLNLLTFFLYGSLGALIVLLPFFLIKGAAWPASAAGAALLPVPVVIGLGSRRMGEFASRHGARGPLTAGCVAVAVGLALYARIGAAPVDYWRDLLAPTLLIALGMGACVAPLTSAIMSSVDQNRVGLASGVNSAIARIAGLIGTALLGFVFDRQDSAAALTLAFREAALAAAAAAALAAMCALLIGPQAPRAR